MRNTNERTNSVKEIYIILFFILLLLPRVGFSQDVISLNFSLGKYSKKQVVLYSEGDSISSVTTRASRITLISNINIDSISIICDGFLDIYDIDYYFGFTLPIGCNKSIHYFKYLISYESNLDAHVRKIVKYSPDYGMSRVIIYRKKYYIPSYEK